MESTKRVDRIKKKPSAVKLLRWSRPQLGVDITDRKIKMVQLDHALGDTKRLLHHWTIVLPSGYIEDGQIVDVQGVAHMLKQVVDRNYLKRAKVHLTISGQKVLLRHIKLPNVSDTKLRKLIDFEINQMKLLPFDWPYYDFVPYKSEQSDEEGSTKENDVLIAAAPSEAIDPYIDVLYQVGLQLVSIESRSMSLFRLIEAMKLIDVKGTFVGVELNRDTLDVSIFHQGIPMVRHNVLHEFSFANFKESCDGVANEITKLVSYFQYGMNYRESVPNVVVVAGDVDGLEQINEYLQERFRQQIILLSQNGSKKREWDMSLLSALAVPIGLALRGGGSI